AAAAVDGPHAKSASGAASSSGIVVASRFARRAPKGLGHGVERVQQNPTQTIRIAPPAPRALLEKEGHLDAPHVCWKEAPAVTSQSGYMTKLVSVSGEAGG